MALPDLHTVNVTSALITAGSGTFTGTALDWRGDTPCVFGVDGTPGGATFTLQWRRNSAASWETVKVNDYSGTVLLGGAMFLPSGQVRVQATGGSGVDGMPYLMR